MPVNLFIPTVVTTAAAHTQTRVSLPEPELQGQPGNKAAHGVGGCGSAGAEGGHAGSRLPSPLEC